MPRVIMWAASRSIAPFVTEFPEWTAFTTEQQEALILTEDMAPPESVCLRLQYIISRARASLATVRQSLAPALAGYVTHGLHAAPLSIRVDVLE